MRNALEELAQSREADRTREAAALLMTRIKELLLAKSHRATDLERDNGLRVALYAA